MTLAWIEQSRKFLVALITAVLAASNLWIGGPYEDWITATIAIAGAFGVYAIPNRHAV